MITEGLQVKSQGITGVCAGGLLRFYFHGCEETIKMELGKKIKSGIDTSVQGLWAGRRKESVL